MDKCIHHSHSLMGHCLINKYQSNTFDGHMSGCDGNDDNICSHRQTKETLKKTCYDMIDKIAQENDITHLKLPVNNIKDTNPKDAVGTKKVPFSTVPCRVIAEIGLAMLEGARKYGRHNYRPAGVRATVYYDATLRHLMAWYEGEDIDPDSGLSHITKAMAGLAVLRDSMLEKNWVDDRPPRVEIGWVQEYNQKAAEIIAKYPDAKKPYTQLNTEKKA